MYTVTVTAGPNGSVSIQDPKGLDGIFSYTLEAGESRVTRYTDSQFDNIKPILDTLVSAGFMTYTYIDGSSSEISNASAVAGATVTDALNTLSSGSGGTRFGWTYKVAVLDADPGAGNFRLNNLDPTLATFIYISEVTTEGVDVSSILAEIQKNVNISIDQTGGAEAMTLYTCSGAPTDAGVYYKIPVTYVDRGPDPMVGDSLCDIEFIMAFAHKLGGELHEADTLANLNSKISDGPVVTLAQVKADTDIAAAITLNTQVGAVTKVLYVDKNRGDTYTANGSIARPFKTIGAATAVATSGDLIKVVPGATDYAEDVVLPGGVSLEGYGANRLGISGDFTVPTGAPVSLRFLTLTGVAKTLTITDVACALLDGFCAGRMVVAGTAIVQAWNFHIVPTTAGVTPLTMTSTGKFHAFMASISSNGDAPAINQSAGTIILNTILASAGRAAAPVILSTGGTCAFLGAQAINSLGGPAVDMSANGAVASNPNLIADLVAVGNVVCGAKATAVEGLKFVSVGVLTGTLLEFRPSSRVGYTPAVGANWVDIDPATVAEGMDRLAAALVLHTGVPIA